jgi:DNA-binding CsgD family transcriptional regulator/tetratricopeptide (TPR) repeat protein
MAGRETSTELIGRERELAQVDEARADAAAGRPRLLVVGGEAGIGKTRLIEAAADRARTDGWRVLIGGCLDIGDGGLPYLPLAEALRSLVRGTSAGDLDALLGPGRADLAAILPELAETTSASPAESSPLEAPTTIRPSDLSQQMLFERMLQLVSRLGEAAPTLVVIEDIHWIDNATRDMLRFLARNLTVERVVGVLTMRLDALAPDDAILTWLAEVGRVPGSGRIDLVRLGRDDVRRQLESIAGQAPQDELVDRIWHRSEGNPMFVEELFSASSTGGSDDRPATLDGMLLTRIAALSSDARRVIAAVAVAGRPVDERLLADVLETDEVVVDERLREAMSHGVIAIEKASGRYRFRHELLREAVETELLPGERRALHERFARALGARPDLADPTAAGAAAELAHHWLGAGRSTEAFEASLDAAAAAATVHAHGDAHRHFEKALELEASLPTGERLSTSEALSLRRRAADEADLAREFDRAMALTREALAMVDPAADPATAGFLHGRLGYLLWASERGEAALDQHRQAVQLVPDQPPTAARARVLAGLGGALMGAAHWAESRDVSLAAVECAVAAGARVEESRARNLLGSDLVAMGEIEAGLDELRRARAIAEGIERDARPPDILMIAHHNLALALLLADRFEEALAEAEAGLAEARRTGLERRYGLDLSALAGDILLRQGRWDEADEVTGAALGLVPARAGTMYLRTIRGRLEAWRGEVDRAGARLADLETGGADADQIADLAISKAETALAAGHPDHAAAAIEGGIEAMTGLDDLFWMAPLIGVGMRSAADEAEFARATHRGELLAAALATGARLEAMREPLAARAVTATARAWIVAAAAEHGRLEGESDPARWATAAEAWDAVPDPYRAAIARFRLAEAELRRTGVRADVGAKLRSAHEVATRLSARPLAESIQRLAARARIDLGLAAVTRRSDAAPLQPASETLTPEAGQVLGLSVREVEVLKLVAAGMSNGDIAERLFISRKTAAVHVTHILDKLGVSNRVEAAMVAERAGLAP